MPITALTLSPMRWWLAPLAYGASILTMVLMSLLPLPGGPAQMLQFAGFCGLLVALPRALSQGRTAADLGLGTGPGGLRGVLIWGLAGFAALSAVSFAFEATSKTVAESTETVLQSFGFGQSLQQDLWAVAVICIGAPLGEEALYRGLIQRALHDGLRRGGRGLQKLAPVLALLLSALAFTMAHGGGGQDDQLYALFAMALIFGGLFMLSGSLWVPVLAHALNNATGLLGPLTKGTLPLAPPAVALLLATPLIVLALLAFWRRLLPS